MNREILQQSLNVLKEWDALIKYQYSGSSEAMTAMQIVAWRTLDTIEGLEQELAKPEQDKPLRLSPMYEYGHLHEIDPSDWAEYEVTPLYKKPPRKEWVGLTSEDWENLPNTGKQGCERDAEIFDWIEAKLKEKNT